WSGRSAAQSRRPAVQIDADDIGGVVTSASGPEAGVWGIAETRELPTRFSRVVVTDEQSRVVGPDLPKATYDGWGRGYGLVDSQKVKVALGKDVDLTAVIAPNDRRAADYYPPAYWYALLHIPPTSEFPGTGDKGNGIGQSMTTQTEYVSGFKVNGCGGG